MPEPHGADVGKGGVCCSWWGRRDGGRQQHGEHSQCDLCGERERTVEAAAEAREYREDVVAAPSQDVRLKLTVTQ